MKKHLTAIVLCIVLVFASMLCGCESTNEQIEKVSPNIWVNLIRVNGGTETIIYGWGFNRDSYRGDPNYMCRADRQLLLSVVVRREQTMILVIGIRFGKCKDKV